MKKILLFSVATMMSVASLNAQTTNYPDPIAEVSLGASLQMEAKGSVAIAELDGKTVRRAIVKGDNMYVLALDVNNAPSIYVVNLTDNSVTTVSTEGAVAPINAKGLLISDIAVTADNYLMACNYDLTPVNDKSAYTYIYSWEKDETTGLPTGKAKQWYQSNMAGLCVNAMSGATMSYSGTLSDGTAMIPSDHLSGGAISGKMRFMRFTKVDGTLEREVPESASAVTNVYGNLSTIYHNSYGAEYKFHVSPVNEDNFIMDGIKKGATELSYDGLALKADFTVVAEDTKVDVSATNTTYFKAAGAALMVAPVVADGKCAGVQLFNVTEGLDMAELVSTVSVEATDDALANVFTCGRSLVEGEEAKIELYVLRNKELLKYSALVGTLTGVDNIAIDTNAPIEYYNLQGVKVDNPENGIFIKKQGNKVIKVVL